MARKVTPEAQKSMPTEVNCAQPAQSSGVGIGSPIRLIDIDLFRYGVISSQVWHQDATPVVRSITISDKSARQLALDLVKALTA